jgi:Fe-Mn family superoxide dismutase
LVSKFRYSGVLESDDSDATRRTVLQSIGASAGMLTLGAAGAGTASAAESSATATEERPYELPNLPYDYDALEPHIDERIMRLHHDKHHQGYVEGANTALERLAEMRAEGDFERIKHVKRDLSFNLSGHILHSLFWESMSPHGGGEPTGDLGAALERDFGSRSSFVAEFSNAAESVEDSGWGMLVYDHLADRLLVAQAEDHNDLAIQGATPLLVLDVWEHAYYLQYQTRRGEYVDAFWNVVDWDAVESRYAALADGDLMDQAE